MYYNYHAKAKQLIKEGRLVSHQIIESYHGISPALLLYFDCHKPMPIRQHRWQEYFELLSQIK